MKIRYAMMTDLDEIAEVESICFPEAEAASRESFEKRLAVFPDCFWVLEEDGKIIGLINGMVSDEKYIRDEMFADAGMHKADGDWQMIFGVEVLPEYQKKGYAYEALSGILENYFTKNKIYMLEAKYNEDNIASAKLLKKLGFVHDGKLRNRRIDLMSGERKDMIVCSMTFEEYKEITGD